MTNDASNESGENFFVIKNESMERFELKRGVTVVGLATYAVQGNVVTFPHFEVNPELQGQGLGNLLARFALDDVRSSDQKANPLCPFLQAYLKRHKDDQELLVPGFVL